KKMKFSISADSPHIIKFGNMVKATKLGNPDFTEKDNPNGVIYMTLIGSHFGFSYDLSPYQNTFFGILSHYRFDFFKSIPFIKSNQPWMVNGEPKRLFRIQEEQLPQPLRP